ncbi:MAG: hypothetical protein EHM28_05470 [Spirochaetaceae bacterium]|nr:MAG: hypothetical protein EHM28_05470 [Spirochaetaceae bacterium]
MYEFLLWAYVANATMLVVHEIDSAYKREWELFKMKIGITGFLVIHIPLVFLILSGLLFLVRFDPIGLLFCAGTTAGGFAAFAIHMGYILKGREEFKSPVSLGILISLSVFSLAQIILLIAVIL